MTEADSVVLRRIHNVGDYTLYELKAAVENGETMTIPTTATEITTSSKVQVIGTNNLTDGTDSGVVSVVYDDSAREFTVTDAGAAGTDDVRILFYVSV